VYTDPEEDWTWCLYEAGYFLGVHGSNNSQANVFCIHHPEITPPRALAYLQTTKAEAGDLRRMINQFISVVNAKAFAKQDAIETAIDQVADAMQHLVQQPFFCPQLRLMIPDRAKLRKSRTLETFFPAEAWFEGRPEAFQEVFEKAPARKYVWHELIANAEEELSNEHADLRISQNHKWLKELSDAVLAVAAKGQPNPLQALIITRDKRRYRPILRRIHQNQYAGLECSLLFVRDVGGQVQNMPAYMNALATAIRVSVRLRYEVFLDFVENREYWEAKEIRERIRTPMAELLTEAEARGLTGDVLFDAFDSAERRWFKRIRKQYRAHETPLFQIIGISRRNLYSSLPDTPLSNEELESISRHLQAMEIINLEFLQHAIDRIRVLIAKDRGADSSVSIGSEANDVRSSAMTRNFG
jgi:hypothetical protein